MPIARRISIADIVAAFGGWPGQWNNLKTVGCHGLHCRLLGRLQVAFAGQDLRHDAPVNVRCGHDSHHDKGGFDSDDEHVLSSIGRHGHCSRSTRPAKRIMNASGDSHPRAAPAQKSSKICANHEAADNTTGYLRPRLERRTILIRLVTILSRCRAADRMGDLSKCDRAGPERHGGVSSVMRWL